MSMLVQIVDPASPAARVLEATAQASLDAYAPRIQVHHFRIAMHRSMVLLAPGLDQAYLRTVSAMDILSRPLKHTLCSLRLFCMCSAEAWGRACRSSGGLGGQSHHSDGYRNPALQNGVRYIIHTPAPHVQVQWAGQILAVSNTAADSCPGCKA